MQQARPMRWFHRLRWKLSLLYTSVTVVLICIGLGIGEMNGYYLYHSLHQPELLGRILSKDAGRVAPYLSSTPVNTEAVSLWLKNIIQEIMDVHGAPLRDLSLYGNPSIAVAVTEKEGKVLISRFATLSGSGAGSPFAGQSRPLQTALIRSALQGETRIDRLSAIDNDGTLVAVAPIFNDRQQVIGTLSVHLSAPLDWRAHWTRVAGNLFPPILFLIILSIVGGIGFGLVTAHHLLARLKVINTAADAWGRGDFAAVANDRAADEMGQLARRLTLMAKDLQGVLALRQELATMEERNRLARDLHDTVKQQVFALAMQIGAAQRMLILNHAVNGSASEIYKRLTEAEKLAGQGQHELGTIIKELQPANQPGKTFEQVLRDHVADWSRQSGVAAEVKCGGKLSLPPPAEQAFFRIVQEALANIARHSRAIRAMVEMTVDLNGQATLSITDNGAGFDPGGTTGGMGLQNMRQRAEALPAGWFMIKGSQGEGVRVMAGCRSATTKEENPNHAKHTY